jgi:hypothetical protein
MTGSGKTASGGQRPGGLWKPIRAGGWIGGLRLETPDLAWVAGEAQESSRSHDVSGARYVDCLRRKQESGYQPADIAPAASTSAIPKGASPLAAGGMLAFVLTRHSFRDPA